MVKRKTEPNRSVKPAKRSAATSQRGNSWRGLKNDGGFGCAPGNRRRRERLTLDCELMTLEELLKRLPNTLSPCKARIEKFFRLSNLKLVPGRRGRR
jgi:hypothetical protein